MLVYKVDLNLYSIPISDIVNIPIEAERPHIKNF